MKNKFIALLFIALSLQALAKNDSTSVIKNGIGLSITPMLSIPINNFNGHTYSSTQDGAGGTAALCQNIVLSKKQNFYLYTELGYLTSAYLDNNIPGLFFGNNGATATYKLYNRFNYGYLSVSIQKVLFHFGKKLGVFAGIGAQASYCYSENQTLEEATNSNGQTTTSMHTSTSYNIDKNNQWAAAGVARLGLMANVTKHLALNIAPVFNFGLNPKYVFTNNNLGFHSLGLNLQIMYSF